MDVDVLYGHGKEKMKEEEKERGGGQGGGEGADWAGCFFATTGTGEQREFSRGHEALGET